MAPSNITQKVSTSVGNLDFKTIHIDAIDIAESFQQFVRSGSLLTGISLDDIDVSVHTIPANPQNATLAELLSCGIKLFDAVVWITAGRPASHPIVQSDTKSKDTSITLQTVAKSVFFCYFFLLTQARYPASREDKNPPAVPNFLRSIMRLDEPQHIYVENISSFNPAGFDARWVRHVKFEGLGQEALSRFGLGVAGYRLFGPFKIFTPKEGISSNLKSAFDFARNVALSEATWDMHPVTRAPGVLTRRGNLNKNLGNLILDVFTDEQIDEMVAVKMLYAKPTREPAYQNYKTWDKVDDISGSAKIFRT